MKPRRLDKDLQEFLMKSSQAHNLIRELERDVLYFCEYGDWFLLKWIDKLNRLRELGHGHKAFILSLVAKLHIRQCCPHRSKRFEELLRQYFIKP